MLKRCEFLGNSYEHGRGKYCRLRGGERMPFAKLKELIGDAEATQGRVEYLNPEITPHGAMGLETFEEFLAQAVASEFTAQDVNAAIREKGFAPAPAKQEADAVPSHEERSNP